MENPTTGADFFGTTSVIAFAAQQRGLNLATVIDDDSARAMRGAIVNYRLHLMVANPSDQPIDHNLPAAVR